MVKGICKFCGLEKELTEHHIINREFTGKDEEDNIIPNVCRDCHDEIHKAVQRNIRLMKRGQEVEKTVVIGSQTMISQAGSVFVGSPLSQSTEGRPIYGMDFLNTESKEKKHFEATISINGSGTIVAVSGSPSAWIYYSFLEG